MIVDWPTESVDALDAGPALETSRHLERLRDRLGAAIGDRVGDGAPRGLKGLGVVLTVLRRGALRRRHCNTAHR